MNNASKFSLSLGGHILSVANRHKDRPALWVENQIISYGQLIEEASKISVLLQGCQYTSDSVAIYSYRSAWAYIGMFATLLTGKTYVPLNPKFPTTRNRQIASESSARIYLVDKRCENQFSQWIMEVKEKSSIIFPDHTHIPDWCARFPMHDYFCARDITSMSSIAPENINIDNPAYLLFTSGTTGRPKGIAVSHGNIMSYLTSLKQQWPLTPDDRCSQIYDQTFDVSVHDIFSCWQAGACLYVVPEIQLLCPADFVNKHKLTCWSSVPSLLGFMKKFRKLNPGAFPTLRYSFFCGEALPVDSIREWAVACPDSRIINLFGPTEATIAITACEWNRDSPPETAIMPVGYPFNYQEVAVVDNKNNPLSMGEKGRLLLAGDQVVKGYWNNPEKTATHFINLSLPGKQSTRWYITGDLASEDLRYGLCFHGREDFQVKINGYRVELEEISSTLRAHFSCAWAAAIPWPVDEITGTATGVVAWISGHETERRPEKEIKRVCADNLPPYMIPSRIIWTDELPRNSSGKIDIGRLQSMTEKIMLE